MGFSLRGSWKADETWTRSEKGEFLRDASVFRDFLSTSENTPFPIEDGRYHLYVSGACPWAHRVLIVRSLFGLEQFLPVSTVHPLMMEKGWVFDGSYEDMLYGSERLHDIYLKADATYTGRVTVPVLFDRKTGRIVNNESAEIIRMLHQFAPRTRLKELDLYPETWREEIDEWNSRIYDSVNNGVYRCGFATKQHSYEVSVGELFDMLDELERHLETRRFMVGEQLTETDIRLFTTLIRFDPVYHGHFKCNQRKLAEFPTLSAYTRRIYQLEGIADTCDLHQIKVHYYGSHLSINPTGIIPLGPNIWP